MGHRIYAMIEDVRDPLAREYCAEIVIVKADQRENNLEQCTEEEVKHIDQRSMQRYWRLM